jgi:phosphoglycolate phosphatase
MIPMQKPLLVFDLDGTLIDSAPDIIAATNRLLSAHKKITLSDEVIIAHIGEGLKKLISDLFEDDHLPVNERISVEEEFLNIYREEMFTRTTIFPGVEKFLSAYQGPVGIITNKTERPAKAIIKHLGLDHYKWVQIFGADTLTERKPSPLPLQTMMKLADHSPQSTFMIGDGIPDMMSAQNANVPAIAIGFGYTEKKILGQYHPRAFLEHYDQLFEVIERLYAPINA